MSTSIKTISMRELQKMSSAAIGALHGPTPIKNGEETIALLVPIRSSASRATAWERFAKAVEADRASRTPEEQAALDAYLDDYEANRKDPAWRERNGLPP